MSSAQGSIFRTTRLLSSIAIAAVVTLSLIFQQLIDNSSLTWQVALAIIALAIGIPHGALDHLVTLPRTNARRMAIFISIYVLIALLAAWLIFTWNVAGFVGVVAMSALHFGVGDAAFISIDDRVKGAPKASRITQGLYALSAGSLPVIIPLTNEKSVSALEEVNPRLVNWHGGWDRELILLVIAVMSCALVALALSQRWRDFIDVSLLAALAFIAPPLVAFAAYFGLWHAMRHTARLTLNLKKSQESIASNLPRRAFLQAIIPGIPALIGTFAVAVLIAMHNPEKVSNDLLWNLLVIVWALTVPHMLSTSRLDKADLAS